MQRTKGTVVSLSRRRCVTALVTQPHPIASVWHGEHTPPQANPLIHMRLLSHQPPLAQGSDALVMGSQGIAGSSEGAQPGPRGASRSRRMALRPFGLGKAPLTHLRALASLLRGLCHAQAHGTPWATLARKGPPRPPVVSLSLQTTSKVP